MGRNRRIDSIASYLGTPEAELFRPIGGFGRSAKFANPLYGTALMTVRAIYNVID